MQAYSVFDLSKSVEEGFLNIHRFRPQTPFFTVTISLFIKDMGISTYNRIDDKTLTSN